MEQGPSGEHPQRLLHRLHHNADPGRLAREQVRRQACDGHGSADRCRLLHGHADGRPHPPLPAHRRANHHGHWHGERDIIIYCRCYGRWIEPTYTLRTTSKQRLL